MSMNTTENSRSMTPEEVRRLGPVTPTVAATMEVQLRYHQFIILREMTAVLIEIKDILRDPRGVVPLND